MKPEQEIVAALRALAESDRGNEAPPEMELRLRVAFRQSIHRRRRRWRHVMWIGSRWIGAAAAAGLVLAGMLWRSPRTEPARPKIQVERVLPRVEAPVTVARQDPPRSRPSRSQPREIVTEFFPLMDAPPPIGNGELVRVSLPSSAMRTVGLPVREDRLTERVQADVLVSEEGLATAIRFVKTSQ